MRVNDPQVFVTTYARYNSQNLDGLWLSLDDYSDYDEFKEAAVKALFPPPPDTDEYEPPDVELMYPAFSGFPEAWYGEAKLSDQLWEWMLLDEDDRAIWEAFLDATASEDASWDDVQSANRGEFRSGAEFAEDLFTETSCIEIPSWVVVDWEATWETALHCDYAEGETSAGKKFFFDKSW